MSWRILRVQLMLETGLPLEYFDNLDITEIGDIVGYKSGKSKVEERQRKDAQKGT
jgi:hypothetical protein